MRKRYLILFVWMSILLFSCNGKEVNMVENIQTNEQMESNDEQKNIKIATDIFENNEIIKKILEMKPVTDFDISASVDDFDTVTFGNYQQAKDEYGIFNKLPVEWILIEKNEDNALLMSKYVLDSMPFNNKEVKPSGEFVSKSIDKFASNWEYSTIREYINMTMYNEIFNESEKKIINPNYTLNKYVYDYGNMLYCGNNTDDNMFLLSEEEIYHYFGKNRKDGKCINKATKGTEYAIKNRNLIITENGLWDAGFSDYYIRPIGDADKDVAVIGSNGAYKRNIYINEEGHGIRPCIFVKLKETYDKPQIDVTNDIRNDEEEKIEINYGKPLDEYKTVKLGNYVINGNKVDLEWYVIGEENGSQLLLSKNSIDKKQFNSNKNRKASWEKSNIREFLNNEFYNNVFNDGEKNSIILSIIQNNASPKSGVKYNDTNDKVFLLSYDEVMKYVGKENLNLLMAKNTNGKNDKWYLRTEGHSNGTICYVDVKGDVSTSGCVDSQNHGIRPAIWVSIK